MELILIFTTLFIQFQQLDLMFILIIKVFISQVIHFITHKCKIECLHIYTIIRIKKYKKEGILKFRRYDLLINKSWSHDLILHDAGLGPIHTPVGLLKELP